jgi:isoquinoline 1-oxidoreductase alpha subunit
MAKYSLNVNGQKKTVDVDPDTPLLWILRDNLDLVGTKFGCGIGQCGACTVHIDGNATRSCSIPVSALKDSKVVTIEGLSENGDHPLQLAWKEHDVPQCGYCQAGQIMTAASFLQKTPKPSSDQIRSAMHGNLCRCASYNRIEKAVATAAEKMS